MPEELGWYLQDEGNTVGPLTLRDLRAVLARKIAWKGIYVWREGLDGWKQAGSVPDLQQMTSPPLLKKVSGPPPISSAVTPHRAEVPGVAGAAPISSAEKSEIAGLRETWWIAEKGKQRGPFNFETLINEIGSKASEVFVWREGYGSWKSPSHVPEVCEELAARASRLPPPPVMPPPPPDPRLVGLRGWLWLVGFGQITGLISSLCSFALISRAPTLFFPLIGMTVVFFLTTVWFFNRSKLFPTAFICQNVLFVVATAVFAIYIGVESQIVNVIGAMVSAAVWIAYALRSKRVAATFTE